MPNRTYSGMQPWSTCDRCGFDYPLSQLVAQKGLKLCTKTCLDNLDIEFRPYMIESVLSSSDQEGVSQTTEVQQNPEEVLF